jgi:hypothetical protein
MSILALFILSPHIGIQPPPFADLSTINLICACILLLNLLGILSLRTQRNITWPLAAILTTLGGTVITFGLCLYYAHITVPMFHTSPTHLQPFGTFTYPTPYAIPFKTLYISTAIFLLAIIVQTITTLFIVIHRPSSPKPIIT